MLLGGGEIRLRGGKFGLIGGKLGGVVVRDRHAEPAGRAGRDGADLVALQAVVARVGLPAIAQVHRELGGAQRLACSGGDVVRHPTRVSLLRAAVRAERVGRGRVGQPVELHCGKRLAVGRDPHTDADAGLTRIQHAFVVPRGGVAPLGKQRLGKLGPLRAVRGSRGDIWPAEPVVRDVFPAVPVSLELGVAEVVVAAALHVGGHHAAPVAGVVVEHVVADQRVHAVALAVLVGDLHDGVRDQALPVLLGVVGAGGLAGLGVGQFGLRGIRGLLFVGLHSCGVLGGLPCCGGCFLCQGDVLGEGGGVFLRRSERLLLCDELPLRLLQHFLGGVQLCLALFHIRACELSFSRGQRSLRLLDCHLRVSHGGVRSVALRLRCFGVAFGLLEGGGCVAKKRLPLCGRFVESLLVDGGGRTP